MNLIRSHFLLMMLLAIGSVYAQSPTGTIAGVVTDFNGARVSGAHVIVTSQQSGLTRSLTASTGGDYSASVLPSGVYHVAAEATGFRGSERIATVEAGTITTVNLTLEIGEVREQVTVDDATPLINYEQHQVGGVVSRAQIENLPLNGRNFLDLAKLEPGVATAGASISVARLELPFKYPRKPCKSSSSRRSTSTSRRA